MYNKRLNWYNLNRKVKVKIPKNVQQQIDYLCREISSVEWSGVLFYDTEGSIENKENFEITLKYVFPMDKGSGGSTEYELGTDEMIDFRMNNPESLRWKIGHIHSHNNMQAYFSGTDNEEIEENSEFHNYYLSIVVNNAGNVVGKIGVRGVSNSTSPYECKSENGQPWSLTVNKKDDVIFSLDCEIDKYSPVVDEEFKKSVADIIKKKEQKSQLQIGYNLGRHNHGYESPPFESSKYCNHDLYIEQQAEQDAQEEKYDDMIEAWSKFYISFGDYNATEMEMEEVLKMIEKNTKNITVYTSQLLEQTTPLFLRFFNADNFEINTVIEDTVIELYSYDNDITTKIAITLEHLLKKIKKDDKRDTHKVQ